MRIDNSGNVGIGISSVQTQGALTGNLLEIHEPSFGSGVGGTLVLSSDNTANGRHGGRIIGRARSYVHSSIDFQADSGMANGGLLKFSTLTAGSATTDNPTERMRIDSSGNVGIGTTSPDSKLHIVDALGGGQLLVATSEADNAEKYGTFGTQHYDVDQEPVLAIAAQSSSSENNVLIGGALGEFNAATSIKFFTAANATTTTGSERMRIDASGNVGIGTSSPSHKLDIVGGGLEITQEETTDAIALLDSNNSNAKYLSIQGDNGECNINNPAGDLVLQRGGTTRLTCTSSGVAINGALSKDSGSFKIDHPLKPDTHHLVHSFIEGPQADNLYSGEVELINGQAQINLDEWFGMTEGTLVALNRDFRVFTTNESDWDNVKGSIENNILTIICQNPDSNATVSWLVIGERQDKEIHESILTDDNGKIIVEPQKVTEE